MYFQLNLTRPIWWSFFIWQAMQCCMRFGFSDGAAMQAQASSPLDWYYILLIFWDRCSLHWPWVWSIQSMCFQFSIFGQSQLLCPSSYLWWLSWICWDKYSRGPDVMWWIWLQWGKSLRLFCSLQEWFLGEDARNEECKIICCSYWDKCWMVGYRYSSAVVLDLAKTGFFLVIPYKQIASIAKISPVCKGFFLVIL